MDNEEKRIKVFRELRERTAKTCCALTITDDEPDILDNKIGGTPYLPIGEPYPRRRDGQPLALLLQVNCKDIGLPEFPSEGILEIFLDNEVRYPAEFEVRYFEEGKPYQTDLPEVDTECFVVKKGYRVTAETSMVIIPFDDFRAESILREVAEKYGLNISEDIDELYKLRDFCANIEYYGKIFAGLPETDITLGGYAEFTQCDPREEGNENTECLFKLDSCADLSKLHLGDAGILSVMISKEALKKKRFTDAILDWDCL